MFKKGIKGLIGLVAIVYSVWAFVNFFYEPVVTIIQQESVGPGHTDTSLWDKAFSIFYHLLVMAVLLCIPLLLLHRIYTRLNTY